MSLRLAQQIRVNLKIDILNNLKVKGVLKCNERNAFDLLHSYFPTSVGLK